VYDIENDVKLDEGDKFEKYLKKKNKLIGNISFIAELHLLNYLPLKVMRFITYNLVYHFSKNYVDNTSKTKIFNTNEEYLEAVIKLFDYAGKKIEENENKKKFKIKSLEHEVV